MQNKDWNGNKRSTFVTLGASSHSEGEREINDYYATEPKAVQLLMEVEQFSPIIWEPACGEGHIVNELRANGYIVYASDIIDRGHGDVMDFLTQEKAPISGFDIITNPPYSKAKEFVQKSIDFVDDGRKVAMFLKLTFLESKSRRKLFDEFPPKVIYVSSSRLKCAKNGNFEETGSSAAAYGWFVWEKGFKGDPIIKWIN